MPPYLLEEHQQFKSIQGSICPKNSLLFEREQTISFCFEKKPAVESVCHIADTALSSL